MTRFDLWVDSGVGLILPIGDLDVPDLPDLRKHLGFAAQLAKIPATLLVDEGEIMFLGSPAIRTLIDEHGRLKRRGGCLALAGKDGKAFAAIKASAPHAPDPFPIFENIEQAVRELNRRLKR